MIYLLLYPFLSSLSSLYPSYVFFIHFLVSYLLCPIYLNVPQIVNISFTMLSIITTNNKDFLKKNMPQQTMFLPQGQIDLHNSLTKSSHLCDGKYHCQCSHCCKNYFVAIKCIGPPKMDIWTTLK